jgi:hypothetical protein
MLTSRYSTITPPVPRNSARGSVRAGSRSSLARYAAAFQPVYAKPTQNSDSANAPVGTLAVMPPARASKCVQSPVPSASPAITNTSSSPTLAIVNAVCTRPPIAVSSECSPVIASTSATATTRCDSPASRPGTTSCRYVAKPSALTAIAAEKPAVSDTQPDIAPIAGW